LLAVNFGQSLGSAPVQRHSLHNIIAELGFQATPDHFKKYVLFFNQKPILKKPIKYYFKSSSFFIFKFVNVISTIPLPWSSETPTYPCTCRNKSVASVCVVTAVLMKIYSSGVLCLFDW
jgi:hypothetical protein